jgi:hypothetical protein
MATFTGSGLNFGIWEAFQSPFVVVSFTPTSFAVNNFASYVFSGTGFTYSQVSIPGGGTGFVLSGGTITSVNAVVNAGPNIGSQSLTGISVPAAAAFQALSNRAAFYDLFYGGDDTFNFAGTPWGTFEGFGGNDTFNIGSWGPNFNQGSFSIDGGAGTDTLNITGGVLSPGPNINFGNVRNVENIKLGAGANYDLVSDDFLVTSGNTVTIDGSALGASNHLTFRMDTATNTTTVTGNLVFFGGAGDDLFQAGKGSNTFNGGGGSDTVSFESGYNETGRLAYNGAGVTANLSIAGFQSLGGLRGGTASFNGIENLIGTQWSDTLIGDSNDNILSGWGSFAGGNDTLIGGAGNDTLKYGFTVDGGAGDDTIIDSTTIDGGSGIDTAIFSDVLFPDQLTLTYSGHTVTFNGRSLTNVEYIKGPNSNSPPARHILGPEVTTADKRVGANQSVALSTLFSATDVQGDAITAYQLWDGTVGGGSGHFAIGGVAQAEGALINITAAQLAQTTYVAGTTNDRLQIRAFDGTSWSASDSAQWAPFNAGPLVNNLPVVTTAPVSVQRNQTLALSSLVSVSDADNDTIQQYQIWDATADPFSGHFEINGVAQAARTLVTLTPTQFAQTTFVTSVNSDSLQIRAFDGIGWSAPDSASWAPFTVSVPINVKPLVQTSNKTVAAGQTLALSSLVNIADADNDPIVQIQLWDGTADPNSGHFTLNGNPLPERQVINITQSQIAQVSFVTGSVGDALQIRASDGYLWSADDNAQWAPFTVAPPVNHPPTVSTGSQFYARNATIPIGNLVGVSDQDGDTITAYQLWDATADPNSGHFEVNGVAQAARTLINLTPSQYAQTTFITGLVGDSLQVRASDGVNWSAADSAQWAPFTITIPPNNPPYLNTTNKVAAHGQSLSLLSTLIIAGDTDGDTLTRYQLWDGNTAANSGYFLVNGVQQAARTLIDLSPAQAAQTVFVVGTVSDPLQIRTFDGLAWSAADSAQWSPFSVNPAPNNPPGVSTSTKNASHGQSFALSSLFSVSDQDGDTITRYQLWDATNDPLSGHFIVNGVDQPQRAVIDITAAQAAQSTFVAGGVGDVLQIRAFDGADWSAADSAQWSPFAVNVPAYTLPVVNTTNQNLTHGQTVALSTLFSVSDPDGDTTTKYQLWDATSDPNSGHFVVNGVTQAARTLINLTPGQIAQTSFVAGTVNDNLQIRAFDGVSWSASDSASWSPFTITASNAAPVVSTTNKSLAHGQSVTLASLFSVSDVDGDAITAYQLWDATADPNSGHFVINGTPQAERAVINLTPSQLAQTSFLVGTVDDNIQIRAFDGFAWSAADSAQWSPFHITAT